MGLCRILKPDQFEKSSLKVRTTPRGDALLTGKLIGEEVETTVAIQFSGKVSQERARHICGTFSGEYFDSTVLSFSAGEEPATEEMSAEAFDTFLASIEEKLPNGSFLALAISGDGPSYEITVVRAGETLGSRDGAPIHFTEDALKDAVNLFSNVPLRVYRNSAWFDHLENLDPKRAAENPHGEEAAVVGTVHSPRYDENSKAIMAVVTLNEKEGGKRLGQLLNRIKERFGGLSSVLGLSVVVDTIARAAEIVKIAACYGVDVVSAPAAGGHFERVMASISEKEETRMKDVIVKLLLALDPTLTGLEAKTEEELLVLYGAKNAQKMADLDAKIVSASAATKTDDLQTGIADLKKSMDDLMAQRTRDKLRLSAEVKINASALPESSKVRLVASLDTEPDLSDDRIKVLLSSEAAFIDSLKKEEPFKNLGRIQAGFDTSEKLIDAFSVSMGVKDHSEWGSVGIRKFYQEITGDWDLQNQINPKRQAFATAISSTFPYMLANVLDKKMLAAYNEATYGEDVLITDYRSAADFKSMRSGTVGGFGTFATVAENGTYQEVTIPDEYKSDFQVAKYGGLLPISWECILNDDVGLIRRLIQLFGRAMRRTYSRYVYAFLTDNSAVYDGVALFYASHSNTGTASLATAALATVKTAMFEQTEPNSLAALGLVPYHIFVPVELENTAIAINQQEYLDSGYTYNWCKGMFGAANERIHVVPHWTDANNYYIMGRPGDCPVIEMAFLNGRRDPEIIVQENVTVGSVFTNDKYTYKIRHIYGGVVLDYRNLYSQIVT